MTITRNIQMLETRGCWLKTKMAMTLMAGAGQVRNVQYREKYQSLVFRSKEVNLEMLMAVETDAIYQLKTPR